MRHEWIFDVLQDLRRYAEANGMIALAQKAEEALGVAKAEIAQMGRGEVGDEVGGGGGGVPPGGRAH